MRNIGKVEYRHAHEAEDGAVRGGLAVVHGEVRAGQLPVRVRQLAAGHGSVENLVVGGSVLHQHAALKQERVADGVDAIAGTLAQADGSGYVVEASGLGLQIERAMTGLNGLIGFAAGELQVPGGVELAGVAVVLDVVGGHGVTAVAEDDIPVQDRETVPVGSVPVLGAGMARLRAGQSFKHGIRRGRGCLGKRR